VKKVKATGHLLYTTAEWISKLAYLNLLWIGCTLLGGIIFGFFPATAAMFAVVRSWIRNSGEYSVAKQFWGFYKKDFIRTNLVGLFLTLIIWIGYVDFRFLQIQSEIFFQLKYIPLYFILIALFLTVLFVFPTYVHYELSLMNYFRNAFMIMLSNPLNSLFLAGILILLQYLVAAVLPTFFLVFGGSVNTYIIMWFCYRVFMKVDERTQIYGNGCETETEL
jgi:uncharacterized membrane protein YesL